MSNNQKGNSIPANIRSLINRSNFRGSATGGFTRLNAEDDEDYEESSENDEN
jgi:hypothetical protein